MWSSASQSDALAERFAVEDEGHFKFEVEQAGWAEGGCFRVGTSRFMGRRRVRR